MNEGTTVKNHDFLLESCFTWTFVSDEESVAGPTGCQRPLEKIHRQRPAQHHGEVPGASRGSRTVNGR